MVADKFDVIFRRIIVDSGFESGRRKLGGGGGGPGPGEDFEVKLSNIEMGIFACVYFRVFIEDLIPMPAVGVLGGVGGHGGGVNIASPNPIWLLYIDCVGVGGAIVHIPYNMCGDMVRGSAGALKVFIDPCCDLLYF